MEKGQTSSSVPRIQNNPKGDNMQSRVLTYFVAMTAFAALATPVSSGAQDRQDHHKKAHYSVKNLGTFGGTASAGNGYRRQYRSWGNGS
jgi:hypothetical protein